MQSWLFLYYTYIIFDEVKYTWNPATASSSFLLNHQNIFFRNQMIPEFITWIFSFHHTEYDQ